MAMQRMVCVWVGLVLVSSTAADAQAQVSAPQPTKEHQLLQRDVGVWDAEMKIWMQGPDSEPLVTKGVERNRAVGSLWVVSNFEGELGGQPFQGHGQAGYDPLKKKFVGTWIDTMSPHLSHMEGTYDEASQELTSLMTGIDPATNQEMKSKSVTKYIDKDTRLFTMYMETPGTGDGWTKMMEVSYKRRAQEGRKKEGKR